MLVAQGTTHILKFPSRQLVVGYVCGGTLTEMMYA